MLDAGSIPAGSTTHHILTSIRLLTQCKRCGSLPSKAMANSVKVDKTLHQVQSHFIRTRCSAFVIVNENVRSVWCVVGPIRFRQRIVMEVTTRA